MQGRLFTLVSAEDESRIFAYGIAIVGATTDGTDEAVTYRRDPTSGNTMFGVHSSAEAACTRFSAITPLELVWPAEEAASAAVPRNGCRSLDGRRRPGA